MLNSGHRDPGLAVLPWAHGPFPCSCPVETASKMQPDTTRPREVGLQAKSTTGGSHSKAPTRERMEGPRRSIRPEGHRAAPR